jgi:hypothetical protein
LFFNSGESSELMMLNSSAGVNVSGPENRAVRQLPTTRPSFATGCRDHLPILFATTLFLGCKFRFLVIAKQPFFEGLFILRRKRLLLQFLELRTL